MGTQRAERVPSLAPLRVKYGAHLRLARVRMSHHPTKEVIAMNADRNVALTIKHGRRLLICLFAVVLLTIVGAVVGGAGFGTVKGTQLKAQNVVAKTSDGSGSGYWTVTSTGQVYAYGGAGYFGGMNTQHLNQPIVGMSSTSDGGGYWLYGADGGVFSFGDATFSGSQGADGSPAPTVGGVSAGSGVGATGPGGATGPAGPAGPAGPRSCRCHGSDRTERRHSGVRRVLRPYASRQRSHCGARHCRSVSRGWSGLGLHHEDGPGYVQPLLHRYL